MSDKKNYGFTTTILHNDRSKPIEQNSLHKPIHTSVAFGYTDARQLASVFQGKEPGFRYGRQGNPTVSALEDKITRWKTAWPRCASPPAWRPSARCSRRCCGRATTWSRRPSCSGTPTACGRRWRGRASRSSFVDATDVANVEAALRPETAPGVRRDHRQPAHPGRRPGPHRRTVPRARHPLRGRQHHDHALSVPPEGGRRRPGGQLADQVDRRPRHGAGRRADRHRPVRLERLPEHRRQLPQAAARRPGHGAAARQGPARLRRLAGPEAAHHIAVGAETLALRMERTCANALALAQMLEADERVAAVHYPGLASHPQHGWRELFRATARCSELRAEGRHRLLRLPEPPAASRSRPATWATRARW
jgi:O-acetylhomoserine (thiol)-lyase